MNTINLPDLLAKAEAAEQHLDAMVALNSYLTAVYPRNLIPLLQWIIEAEKVLGRTNAALHNAVLAITLQLSPDHEDARAGANALAEAERCEALLQEIKGVGRG